ncbi:MAG: alanine--tRNA ligase [Thermovirgaceae bacterium]
MKYRTGRQLRELFLSYFEQRGHRRFPSFSLVPDDPTILFTIAGMVPFKPYFLGQKTPEMSRAVTSQKCVRTNDIDNVGRTARHHTFFEMLGNFSFGDYFKAEAAFFAWEFLTKVIGLDPDRLYPTVYVDDDEAFEIWNRTVGVPKERIYRLGAEDNFWSVGPVGPCGPCSELIYDQGPAFSCGKPDCDVGCSCDRYLEIWNLVFMQYNRYEDGTMEPLPKQNIDTGMGLERLASVVQQVKGDFETDLFRPLIDRAAEVMGIRYGGTPEGDMALRVISDHFRALAFMIADGVLPSNEGRGYVLRRILRRAVRYGRMTGMDRPFLTELMPTLKDLMGDPYEELAENESLISQVLEQEERRFGRTLEQGTNLLEGELALLTKRQAKTLDGKLAFELYDTYGFPLELTEEICAEKGIAVDRKGFETAMQQQRERARAHSKRQATPGTSDLYEKVLGKAGVTEFVGYTSEQAQTLVSALFLDGEETLVLEEGQEGEVILDSTPFYAEKGGQVGDTGSITWDAGEALVTDTYLQAQELTVHKVKVLSGRLEKGAEVNAAVDERRRRGIKAHHTATHILHEALIRVLGDHVKQAGSLVTQDFLRFDFTHVKPLSTEEIEAVEAIMFETVTGNTPLQVLYTSVGEAKKLGAKALFDEKYGEEVRVIRIPGYSAELCGGTHVDATGDIGVVKIVREEGIGSGLRRITAVAHDGAFRLFQEQSALVGRLAEKAGAAETELEEKLSALLEERKDLKDEMERLSLVAALEKADTLLEEGVTVGEITVVTGIFENTPQEILRQVGDHIRQKKSPVVTCLASLSGSDVTFIVMADKPALKAGVHAGKLAASAAKVLGGGGGGRPDIASAGAKTPDGLEDALKKVPGFVGEQIGK